MTFVSKIKSFVQVFQFYSESFNKYFRLPSFESSIFVLWFAENAAIDTNIK